MKQIQFSDLNLLDVGNTIQMAGALWAGKGRLILCFFPHIEEDEAPKIEDFPELTDVLYMSVDEWNQFIRQTDLLETEVLAQLPDKKLGKVILRKSQRQISQNVSWEVYRRDGFACRYCGNDRVPLTVDHLVTWEEGGPSIPANLLAADKCCNSRRGSLPYDQWLNHPYYQKVSRNLTGEQREANRKLLETLPSIPRMVHKPKHR